MIQMFYTSPQDSLENKVLLFLLFCWFSSTVHNEESREAPLEIYSQSCIKTETRLKKIIIT